LSEIYYLIRTVEPDSMTLTKYKYCHYNLCCGIPCLSLLYSVPQPLYSHIRPTEMVDIFR